MKRVTISATFPELKSGKMYATGRGEASTLAAALSRAFKDALKQVKGKRIHTIQATISVTDKTPENGGSKLGVAAGLKCNECLIQHKEAKPLNLDGTCFCCNRGHRD